MSKINKLISYSFYALFAITPLIMYPKTSELFELNKMLFVYGIAIIIFLLWGSKIILTQSLNLKKSILDIPIILFVLSQLAATLVSIDPHVSFWGYYSRFNGGLLSTLTYVFLYYALKSHLREQSTHNLTLKMVLAIIFGGVATTIWGLPSHFGLDPTCLVFRGELNDACWTDAFKPQIRIFSTLGQPNWLAAFLAYTIPLTISLSALIAKKDSPKIPFLNKWQTTIKSHKKLELTLTLSIVLMTIALLYTRSQSGFLGFSLALATLAVIYLIPRLKKHKNPIIYIKTHPQSQTITVLLFAILALTFVIGVPISKFENFTLQGFIDSTDKKSQEPSSQSDTVQNPTTTDALGGTDSGSIRLIVWSGALNIIRQNPILGTGPETFAYAYYKNRPVEHNMTTEWDYLYNKAHNEFLNYGATSGLFGLTSYIAFIILFSYLAVKYFFSSKSPYNLIALGLFSGFTSLQISHFFGFSVVNSNLLLFLTPPLFFALTKAPKNSFSEKKSNITFAHYAAISLITALTLLILIQLLRFWTADQSYALGANLSRVNEHGQANVHLQSAYTTRPQEPLFQNELSQNLAHFAAALNSQNNPDQAKEYANNAKALSDQALSKSPQNLVYVKTRIRMLFLLTEVDEKYTDDLIKAINKAKELAPTDAKVSYNAGLIYGQAKMYEESLKELQFTTQLKPDYRDAYYAIGLIAQQAAEEKPEESERFNEIAKSALTYIVENISAEDRAAQELLDELE